MINKIIFFSIACMTIGTGLALAQSPSAAETTSTQGKAQPLNRIVAIVNDEIITESDLDSSIEQLKQQLIANHVEIPSEKRLREDALQQLINYRLQLQMAARNDIKPTSSEIDQALEQIAGTNHLTLDQLKQQLILQHSSYEEFRHKINEQLIITKLQQQMVAGQVKVTDEEVADFKKTPQGPQEYQLVDFFLPLSEHPTAQEMDQALTAAHNIRRQIEKGVSIDKITPAYQDLGWRASKDLPQLFVDQLPTLTTTHASPPLRAPNGYHVLKLIATRNAGPQLTNEQIRQILFRQKYEKAVKTAVDKARKEAYVQIIEKW